MACRGFSQRQSCPSTIACRGIHQLSIWHRPWRRTNGYISRCLRADCSTAYGSRSRSGRTSIVTKAAAAAPADDWRTDAAWWTLCTTVFIYISGIAMLAPVLPSIIGKFNIAATVQPAQAMGLLVSTYAASLCVGSLVVGRASDYFGPKPVMVVTLMGGAAMLLLSSLAQTYNQFLLARAATGVFGGTITCAQAYVGGLSKTPEQRSARVSTMQAVTAVGYVCGPGIGGALHSVGTMAPLVAAGVLSLVACMAALVTLPHIPPLRTQVATARKDSEADKDMTSLSDAPVATATPEATPIKDRSVMVAAARRDPALLLMLSANFLGAFVNPVYSFFTLTAISTLNWAPSREVALFFTLAGALAVPTSAAVKTLVQRVGLMRLSVTCMMIRSVGFIAMGATVMGVSQTPALCGTVAGGAIVMCAALFTTISNTVVMACTSVSALELVQARGGGSIRGEVLSWLTMVQFMANISAPLVMGWATAIAPVDARFMFITAACVSVLAASFLQRVIQLEANPVTELSNASNRSNGSSVSSSGSNVSTASAFRSIAWGSEEYENIAVLKQGKTSSTESGVGGMVDKLNDVAGEGDSSQHLRPKAA